MFVGGRIESDGIIEAHAGECILNAKATQWMDTHYPKLLDQVNKGDFPNDDGTANSNVTSEEQQGMLGEQGTREERKQWTVNELVDHITNKYTKTMWTVRELASTFYIGNDKAQKVRSLLTQTQKTGENTR